MIIKKYETGTWGTCYNKPGEIEIISITSKDVSLMVDDENCGVINFPSTEIKISKKDYELLKKAAKNKNRKTK